ncbi:MAG: exodeoxyribonuclease VII large subunit, partial [Thermoguttaceae bacterium]
MPLPSDQRPLSVWELTSQLKDLLEGAFPAVWVAGEISNFNRSQSGHCYLTLKDDRAQLRAVMWRGVAVRTRFDLHDGLEVICRGHIDVYAARGSYQLVIGDIVPRGMGALELALRQLREKLAREGLFDAARKRPLPAFVRRIAVVTSPTGAAIRDFLQVLGRRWRGADVLVVPVRVQGDGAAAEIAAAIETVNRLPAAGKGDSPQLCEAPSGPFRQMGTVPFSPPCADAGGTRRVP